MSTSSKKLDPAVDVANQRVDKAANQVAQTQARMTSSQEQLSQIDQYIREYQEETINTAKEGISAYQLKARQQFITRLRRAKQDQHAQLQQTELQLQETQKLWKEQFIRAKAVSHAADQLKAQEAKAQDRRDQSAMDEHGRQRQSGK